MRVQILPGDVVQRTVTSRKSGQPTTFREQVGLVKLGKHEVREISVSLDRDQAAYLPGEYEVLDGSFYVDQYKKLALGRLALRPVADAAAGSAASSPLAAPAVLGQRKTG